MRLLLLLVLFSALGCSGPRILSDEAIENAVEASLIRFVDSGGLTDLGYSNYSGLDSARVSSGIVHLYFNDALANSAIRPSLVDETTRAVARASRRSESEIRIWSRGSLLPDLVPNIFRSRDNIDPDRLPQTSPRRTDRDPVPPFGRSGTPLTRNLDEGWADDLLLHGRHIALWPSHGWYYEPSLDRWEWQRARLFGAVEDKLPLAFTLQYLVPMLENAGASVVMPRERDIQTAEIVIDNDDPYAQYSESSDDFSILPASPGFKNPAGGLLEGDNPFTAGSFRILPPADSVDAVVQWVPEVVEAGSYAVYVSYGNVTAHGYECVENAEYVVSHQGGQTRFAVNQCMSFGTWVYLGNFEFAAGADSGRGSVKLTNHNSSGSERVGADASRFGGGMGSVERGGAVSGRPRYLEGARYYLQYAGFPDSLVYDVWGSGDYIDDYRSRGEWVNYLVGAPFGPNANRVATGLGVPIDLSIAFHTDAGMAQSDTTIGTLLIYSSEGTEGERVFPDGVSRIVNRDIADILQTEIIDDMRRIADREWPRRALWDRDYSETVRPNVPSVLLELLAHQNFTDMQFALDPRFRFAISRSIYKGVARFLAYQHNRNFVVQPLPVEHFSAELNAGHVQLKWSAVEDSLEPSATPDSYVLYTRVGSAGWGNGVQVFSTEFAVPAPEVDVIHSYKIRALNAGGLSFPSEVLSVGKAKQSAGQVLIVNGFDRVAGPEWFDEGNIAGFPQWLDHGVADGFDVAQTGPQFRFTKKVPWTDDDAPGFGASFGSEETAVIPGNTFDYSFTHGRSVLASGYSFSSVSDESFWSRDSDWPDEDFLIVILGEEKLTPWPKGVSNAQFAAFPEELQGALRRFSNSGRGMFLSGAYVGSELSRDSSDIAFSRDVLGFTRRTDHAVMTGDVIGVGDWSGMESLRFKTSGDIGSYSVEAPDAIRPAEGGQTILRYTENNMGAATARTGERPVVVFAFPFETIEDQADRDEVMNRILSTIRMSGTSSNE